MEEKDENEEILKNFENQRKKTKILKNLVVLEKLNFFEIFIHSVLFFRKVYPSECFKDCNIYGMSFKYIEELTIVNNITDVCI